MEQRMEPANGLFHLGRYGYGVTVSQVWMVTPGIDCVIVAIPDEVDVALAGD
jgi:hypothetical protein